MRLFVRLGLSRRKPRAGNCSEAQGSAVLRGQHDGAWLPRLVELLWLVEDPEQAAARAASTRRLNRQLSALVVREIWLVNANDLTDS
jgi:hypothetical protein